MALNGLDVCELEESGRAGILNSEFGARNDGVPEDRALAGVMNTVADVGLEDGMVGPNMSVQSAI